MDDQVKTCWAALFINAGLSRPLKVSRVLVLYRVPGTGTFVSISKSSRGDAA